MVQGAHEKIGEDVVLRQDSEKCFFKCADPKNDIDKDAVIGKSAYSMLRFRSDDTDIPFFHMKFLLLDIVGAGPFQDADNFQKRMGVENCREITDMPVELSVKIFPEKRWFIQPGIQKKPGKGIRGSGIGKFQYFSVILLGVRIIQIKFRIFCPQCPEYSFQKEWLDSLDLAGYSMVYICGLEVEAPTGKNLVNFLEENRQREPSQSLPHSHNRLPSHFRG